MAQTPTPGRDYLTVWHPGTHLVHLFIDLGLDSWVPHCGYFPVVSQSGSCRAKRTMARKHICHREITIVRAHRMATNRHVSAPGYTTLLHHLRTRSTSHLCHPLWDMARRSNRPFWTFTKEKRSVKWPDRTRLPYM